MTYEAVIPARSRGGRPKTGGRRIAHSGAELLLQQLVDLSRRGLTLRGLHYLTDERVEGLVLAGTEFLDRLLVRGEHFVDDRFDRGQVSDLLQALLLDHFIRARAVAIPECVEDLLGGRVGDRAVGDAR